MMHSGRPATTAVAAVLVVLAFAAGCTGEESPPRANGAADPTSRPTISLPPGSPSPLPVVATAAPADGQQLKVEINDLRADSQGLAVLRFTVTNTGSEAFDVREFADPKRDPVFGFEHVACRIAPSGVTLVDKQGQTRYQSLYRFDGGNRFCMNSTFSFRDVNPVDQGRQLTLYTAYVLPENLDSVTVEIPSFEPVPDVPVSR